MSVVRREVYFADAYATCDDAVSVAQDCQRYQNRFVCDSPIG